MGTMDSFVPTEGSKYSSSRKRKGNCTKNPRIFFNSSAAFVGSSFANLGLLMKSRSWAKLFTWSLGRHRNTWSKQKISVGEIQQCRVPVKDQSTQCKFPRMGVTELTAQRTGREEVCAYPQWGWRRQRGSSRDFSDHCKSSLKDRS